MKYEVTIGIPLFNAVEYIRDTLGSALSQSFDSIEYLIVDDCGDDGSIDVVSCMQREHFRGGDIRILHNGKNRGVSYSRNRIIDEARGKYLYFLDSDDKIEADAIQKLHAAIVRNQAEVVYASYDIVDVERHSAREVYQKDDIYLDGFDKLAEYVFRYNNKFQVMACNSLINLAFLRQSGIRFYDTQYWEDMVFTYELALKVNQAVLLSDITYHYLRRFGSLSHFQKRETFHKDEIQNNIRVIGYLKNKCQQLLGRNSLPYLCYNLEMNSFYIDCHILKHTCRITPSFTNQELRVVLSHPLSLGEILKFQHVLLPNVALWFLGKLPLPFFKPAIWLLGKLRKAI